MRFEKYAGVALQLMLFDAVKGNDCIVCSFIAGFKLKSKRECAYFGSV